MKGSEEFLRKAVQVVADYAHEHLDKTDREVVFDVFVVWYCKTLRNHKALLSTTLYDGMYYECTYNGDKDEMYLDAYKKFENRAIPCAPTHQAVQTSDDARDDDDRLFLF